jgi:hypothetical protein
MGIISEVFSGMEKAKNVHIVIYHRRKSWPDVDGNEQPLEHGGKIVIWSRFRICGGERFWTQGYILQPN